jgi:hypothetical protein
MKYLEENVASTRIELTDDEIAQLDDVIPAGAATGTRYENMSNVHR